MRRARVEGSPRSRDSAPSALLAAAALEQTQAQRVELDEAGGVALVVDLVFLEGHVRQAIEALRALAADHDAIALIELQAHGAFDMLLALVDQGLQHLALGA